MMIINAENLIFVGCRMDTKDSWQMPQGGIDTGETPSKAAMREMKEEIGTDKGCILAETKNWYSYNIPKIFIPRLWNGQFRGQKQKWFLIKFTGIDSDINLLNETQEFSSWKWVDASTLLEIIIPWKRKLYKAVCDEFSMFLNN